MYAMQVLYPQWHIATCVDLLVALEIAIAFSNMLYHFGHPSAQKKPDHVDVSR